MSSAEPSPPSGSSLLARLGWALKDRLLGGGDEPTTYDAVKLVHADDLEAFTTFPRYQDFDGVTYGEYRAGVYGLERRRRTVADLISAEERLAAIDTDEVVGDRTEWIDIPRRALLRRHVRRSLPEAPRPGTWVESSAGVIRAGILEVDAGWRSQSIRLAYRGPSRCVHAAEIAELRSRLDARSDEQRRTMEEVRRSRYAHPVLFISHRWEDVEHPDPSGAQLERLRTLKDCFLVYDYSSFPQPPRNEPEERDFREMLGAMDRIVSNVVVLEGEDYLTRGWCLYEYLVASLRSTTVCDEVADERFAELRDWASTPPPVTMALRDSFESQQQNYINESLLATVNEVLPLYHDARFTEDGDRELVTSLLVEHLKSTLPPIKEHQPYLGEWKTTPWTDEMLAPFFRGEAQLPRLQSHIPVRRFDTAVPSTLQQAVERRYRIERYDSKQLLNPLDTIVRVDFGALFNPARRRNRR